jgi:phosphohistidine phosphatase
VSKPVRTLWLLRHAKAVADPPQGDDDFDRLLARRDTGSALTHEPSPQVAFVSPAARTMATAELALAGLTPAPRQVSPADLYGADPDDVLRHLRTLDDDVAAAMVVGHNPTAQALALGLLDPHDKGRDKVVRRGFPTCALGVYRLDIARWADVEGGCAALVDLLVPPFEKD